MTSSDPPPAVPRWRRALAGLTTFVAWCIALALAAAVYLRVFHYDTVYELVWLNSFTRYVYLPAYLCGWWARKRQRWALFALSCALVACHLSWVLPDFAPATTAASAADTGSDLRIFLANVNARNREFGAMFDEIAAAQPHVVVVVEYDKAWHAALLDSPVMQRYPHVAKTSGFGGNRTAIYAKLPFVSQQQQKSQYERVIAAEIEWQGRPLHLFGLHAPRPIESHWRNYFDYWDNVRGFIEAQPTPLVVLGDFNATQYGKLYHQLTSGLLRGAHESVGRGYATTWPNGKWWLPPIRIDHVLVSPELEVVRVTEGIGRGSDHRPVIVDLRFANAVE